MTTTPAAQGSWITIEGIDGCGKSTQVARLAAKLGADIVREPGQTAVGAEIRQILLHGHAEIDPDTEIFLFAADRAQLVAEVIAPVTGSGRHVVADRSVWSSVAYQGYARQLGAERVLEVNGLALKGRWPDVVVLLDADPAVLASRVESRYGGDMDRIERAGDGFFARAAAGFRELAADRDWVVVDATGTVEDIEAEIFAAVSSRLGLT